MTVQNQKAKKVTNQSTYIQMFIYKIPNKNTNSWLTLQKELSELYKKNGILNSEFYKLVDFETFSGFINVGNIVSAKMDEEEIWVEIDHYKDKEDRNSIVENLNNDKEAESIFNKLMGIGTQGHTIIMGEFSKSK